MDVLNIKFRSRNLPGLKQTELGHIEILDWGETTTLTHENWSSYVGAGSGVKISFVVGTWHGLRRKKCARCAKPHSQSSCTGKWREWYVILVREISSDVWLTYWKRFLWTEALPSQP